MLLSPAGNQITLYPYYLALAVVIQNALAPLASPTSLSCAVILHKCTLCSLLLASLALQIAAHCVRCTVPLVHVWMCWHPRVQILPCYHELSSFILRKTAGKYERSCDFCLQYTRTGDQSNISWNLTYLDFLATITNEKKNASANLWPVSLF